VTEEERLVKLERKVDLILAKMSRVEETVDRFLEGPGRKLARLLGGGNGSGG
jgi:hypothetical protein